jgi:hypothetical protein
MHVLNSGQCYDHMRRLAASTIDAVSEKHSGQVEFEPIPTRIFVNAGLMGAVCWTCLSCWRSDKTIP